MKEIPLTQGKVASTAAEGRRMKRSPMSRGKGFKRLSLEEARDRLRTRRGLKATRYGKGRSTGPQRAGKALRAKPDRKLAAWSRKVRERDGNQCQWPGGCGTGDTRIDAHHIAERSLRPDLRYSVPNGICLCRTHHDFLPLHREAAIALKLISTETYEAARKLEAA